MDPGEFYAENVQKALRNAQVQVSVINVLKGSKIPEQIGSILSELEKLSSCIVLGWDEIGELENEFGTSHMFREQLLTWVDRGGRFIVQGEHIQENGHWPAWFGKSWEASEYSRTTFSCNGKCDDDIHWCKWYHKAKGAVTTDRYNVKANMLAGVTPEDNLFGTTNESKSPSGWNIQAGQSAIALGKYGDGLVSCFGDVNGEEKTCDIMAVLARGK